MRIKSLMLVTVSSLALTGAAAAADLPMKAGPAVATSYNWTGFYLGGSIAAALYSNQTDLSSPFSEEGYAVSGTRDKSKLGWGAGVQAGYNVQMRRAVFGVEADYTFLSANASRLTNHVDISPPNATITAKADGLVTVRGRFGWDVGDGLLIYGTAGVGWLQAKYNYDVAELSGGVPKGGNFRSSKWSPAFVAGGGAEYMLNRNWSVRAEVLWVKPQTVEGPALDTNYFPVGTTVRYDADLILAKWGVNYRF